jgi:rhodanese-related sulfurtransferase
MKTYLTLLFTVLLAGSIAAQGPNKTTDTIYRAITVVQADSLIDANPGNPDFVIIDVRAPVDYNNSHLQNAININYYDANFSAQISALDHNKMYLLYCQAGSRSTLTYNMMQTMDFREVYNMLGGINGWVGAGYSTVTTTGISLAEQEKPAFEVYPTLVVDQVHININNETGYFIVSDFSGRKINDLTATGNTILDLSGYPSGMYFITLISGAETSTKAIIKQ